MLTEIWTEDAYNDLKATQRKTVRFVVDKVEDFIGRIYPVLFTDGFKLRQGMATESTLADERTYNLRRDLIIAALRYDSKKSGKNYP